MEITGTVIRLFPTREISPRFSLREIVIEIDSHKQYSQPIAAQVVNDKINLLDEVQEGDTVTAHINLRGRHHASSDRYYNSLNIWRIEIKNKAQAPAAGAANSGASQTWPPAEQAATNDGDDIPF